MVEVVKNLYIGDRIDAYREDLLKKLNIRFIVNCAGEIENKFEGKGQQYPYKYFSIRATEEGNYRMIDYFKSSTDFIQQGLNEKVGVLVHCAYGINRSATIVIAYLMRFNKMNFTSAF